MYTSQYRFPRGRLWGMPLLFAISQLYLQQAIWFGKWGVPEAFRVKFNSAVWKQFIQCLPDILRCIREFSSFSLHLKIWVFISTLIFLNCIHKVLSYSEKYLYYYIDLHGSNILIKFRLHKHYILLFFTVVDCSINTMILKHGLHWIILKIT